MGKKTIAELDKVIKQMQVQKDNILRKQKNAERENLTRQKIILGGWLLMNDLEAVEKVKTSLVRDQDRLAFGLQPLEVQKTSTNAETGVLEAISVTH